MKNNKLENYINFHDNKIKQAKNNRLKSKTKDLSKDQKVKLLVILNYIKSHPKEALSNKEKIKIQIKKILSK